MTATRTYRYERFNAQGRRCCASDRADAPTCGKCQPRSTAAPVAATAATAATPQAERRTLAEWREYIAQALGVGSIVVDMPDGYRTAKDAAPRAPEPTDDPNYSPHGQPPDGWTLALNARNKEAR